MKLPIRSFLGGLTYRSAVFARDGLICSYCGLGLAIKDATVDHVEPLSRGGRNHPDNMVVACVTCNGRKGCLTLTEFLLGQEFTPDRWDCGGSTPPKPEKDRIAVGGTSFNSTQGRTSPKDRLKKYRKRNISNTRRVEAIMRAHGKGRLVKPLHMPTLTSKLGEHPALRALLSEEIEIDSRLAA